MSDKPILFSGPMVRALIEGRKTQTRRAIRDVPDSPPANCHPLHAQKHPSPYLDAYCGERKTATNPRGMSRDWHWWQVDDRLGQLAFRLPYAPGDRLWVRETCATWEGGHQDVVYRADETEQDWSDLVHDARNGSPWKVRSSIHMPRWASRLTLIVTDVRVQRLQEISEADAVAEGCPCQTDDDLAGLEARGWFRDLWDSLNAKRAPWASNPWVVAITFRAIRANIDSAEAQP